jgi:HrpA-like RNA helicase
MLTVVGMLSAENIFFRPGRSSENSLSATGAAAHKRFSSYEGDLPSLLNVYNAWKKEAIYTPSGKSNQHKKKKLGNAKMLHGDWCKDNFISGRALVRAHDVRNQLSELASRAMEKNGLAMNVDSSCASEMTLFFKCLCAGLFLQVATRVPSPQQQQGARQSPTSKSGLIPSHGQYKTRLGGNLVSVHPTSFMFGRNPPAKCVVYTELLQTSKLYIRGVTQIREEWVDESA